MTDCLIIGFNDINFDGYVNMVESMGKGSGAYRDLNLAFIEYKNKPYHALGILNYFYFQYKGKGHRPFHNTDTLWPAIIYLGTYLSRRGFVFDYINSFQLEKAKLKDKLTRDNILTVAITTTVYITPHPIIEIISFIRKYNNKVKIIVGGPYVMNQAKQFDAAALRRLFKYIGADIYVINQEGEFALFNIIKALKNNLTLHNINNIAYKTGEGYVITSGSKEENPLDENMVDYKLFPKEDIGEFVSLSTAKSCPFSCAYCGFPQRAGSYRYLNVDCVEKALNAIKDIGTVTTLTFLDDTFNVPAKRFKEILRMMIRNNYNFKWNSFYRCDYGDEETITLMKDAGCEGVFLGIESGSDSMLKMMDKTATRNDNVKAISLLKKAGILTHASFIIGFPGETYETVEQTIEFIEETAPDFFRAQLWYCDPLTPIWNKREEYGIKGSGFNWSHNTMDFQTACDLIDKIFLSVEGAVWMPQYGFELWSIFYLQRKWMSLSQVKTFVRCFNAVIREKLVFPDKKQADPELLAILRQSCRFDLPVQPDIRALKALSGSGYIADQAFWTKEFRSESPTSNIESDRYQVEPEETGKIQERISSPLLLNRTVLNSARMQYSKELSTVILAAYSILLSRLNGREETVIISAFDGKNPSVVPLRLYPSWDMTFMAFFLHVREKLAQAAKHQRYAFHILKNAARMAEYGCSCPIFDVGYVFYGDKKERNNLKKTEPFRLVQGIKIILEVIENENNAKIDFLFIRKAFHDETIKKLGYYLLSILDDIVKNPDVLLGEIVLQREVTDHQWVGEKDASENFHF